MGEILPDPDNVEIIVGEPVPFTKKELWQMIRSAFQSNMNDHGNKDVDLNWAHSFHKRLWGEMRVNSRNKRRLLLEKQQGHVTYKAKNGQNTPT